MANLSDGLEQYLVPNEQSIKTAIITGIVVVDSNVILDLYRFAATAREQLLDVLERIGDRLWMPHQVALEFHRNRLSVMADREEAYQEVIKVIRDLRQSQGSVEGKIKELANRVLLPTAERNELLRLVSSGLDKAEERMVHLRSSHGLEDSYVDDPILERLELLFRNRVGDPLGSDEHKEVHEEALRRVKAQEPPGYRDNGKDDPTGDYLVWYQALKEAGHRKAPLLFVTRDAKEDWFLRIKRQTVCGRPELIAEARAVAGVPALIMQTQTLLFHARTYLEAAVSEETLQQAALAEAHPISTSATLIVSVRTFEKMRNVIDTLLHDRERRLKRLRARLQRTRVAPNDDPEWPRVQPGIIRDLLEEIAAMEILLAEYRQIQVILASPHMTLEDSVRLSWSPPPDVAKMVRLARMATQSDEEDASPDAGVDPVLETDPAQAVLSDGSAIAIGMKIKHRELGMGRVAATRRIVTSSGSLLQVQIFLDDGGACWVSPQELSR